MSYVDGYVLPVPRRNLAAYRRMAKAAGKVWKKFGALQYVEAVADDMNVKFGLPFPKLVKPKPGETIMFSFIVYKSRAHRDKVNAKVMADPRLNKMMQKSKVMPFDMKRMAYGGFKYLVNA